jgi:hypothetical protein
MAGALLVLVLLLRYAQQRLLQRRLATQRQQLMQAVAAYFEANPADLSEYQEVSHVE